MTTVSVPCEVDASEVDDVARVFAELLWLFRLEAGLAACLDPLMQRKKGQMHKNCWVCSGRSFKQIPTNHRISVRCYPYPYSIWLAGPNLVNYLGTPYLC
jgi:hypothetical protein